MSAALRRALPLLALFACVLLARVAWVAAYAEPVPYWDQWDAEAAFLLKPWIEGSWRPTQLLDPHNEHRIAYTRLIALALFEANDGHWDNLVSAFANTALMAALAALLWACLAPGLSGRRAPALLFALLLALGSLPFGWENLLVGFQNQFSLMAALALLSLAAAAHQRDRFTSLVPLWLLSVLGLFTMASGLLAPVAAGAVLVVRAWLGQLRPGVALAGNALLAPIAILAWLAVPVLEPHQALKAQDPGDFLAALGHVMSWPLGGSYFGAAVIWLPTGLFLWRLLRTRNADGWQCLAGGLALWVLLQALAIAHSRGHGLLWPSSRYTEVLALGVVANAWLALRAWSDAARDDAGPRRLAPAVVAMFLVAAGTGLAKSLPVDLGNTRLRATLGQIQTAHLRDYLQNGDPALLQVPFHHIPYPDPARLAGLLDDPTLRAALPWTLRQPMAGQGGAVAGDFQAGPGDVGLAGPVLSCRGDPCAPGQGRYDGPVRATATGWRFQPAWSAGDAGGLRIDGGGAREGFAQVPGGGYRTSAVDASDSDWLALSAPVEAGRLSVAAARLQAGIRSWLPPMLGRAGSELRTLNPEADGPVFPQALALGEELVADLPSPRDGLLLRVAINVATFHQPADGHLRVRLCAGDRCAGAEAALAGLRDNDELLLALDQPLWLARGQRLQVGVVRPDGERPVALWLPTAAAGEPALQLRGADGTRAIEGHSLRLALGFLR